MKKILSMVVVLALFFIPAQILAVDSASLDSKVQVNMGNFAYNEENGNPHAYPGPHGGFIQVYAWPENGGYGYGYMYMPQLDGETESGLALIGESVSPGKCERLFLRGKVAENDSRITILKGPPQNMMILTSRSIRSGKDDPILPLMAKGAFLGRIDTNAKYIAFKVKFKDNLRAKGISIGPGAAANIGADGSGAVGAIFGWSSAEKYMISLIEAECYGGYKPTAEFPAVGQEKAKASKEHEKTEAMPPEQKSEKPTAPAEPGFQYPADLMPIFFGFDKDVPLPNQQTELVKWARWIGQNMGNLLASGKAIRFEGYCDVRPREEKSGNDSPGEVYNDGLGGRRARPIMYRVAELLIDSGKDQNEKNKIRLACKKLFRATSAGRHSPHFTTVSGLSQEQIHQLNRRVDIVIVDKNITVENAIGFVKGE